MEFTTTTKTQKSDRANRASSTAVKSTPQTPTHKLLQMQQTIGNRAVSRLIQTKLKVGKPGDVYEREADHIADRVMQMPNPQGKPGLTNTLAIQPLSIQRMGMEEDKVSRMAMEEEKPIQKQAEDEESSVQMKEEEETQVLQPQMMEEKDESLQMKEEDEPVQTKTINSSVTATPKLENRLNSSKGGGSPLSSEVRSYMEPRFGADLSGVRVHTDSTSVQMNKELGAQAFTHGKNIYFGAGKSPNNDALTAHELTHTIQQTGGLQRKTLGTEVSSSIQLKENIQPPTAEHQNLGQQQQIAPQDIPPASNSEQGQQTTPQNAAIIKTSEQQAENTPVSNVSQPASSTETVVDKQENIVSTDTPVESNNQAATGDQFATFPENDPGFKAVVDRTKKTAKQQKNHPPAAAKSAEAQAAANPPSNEVESKAKDRQVQEMNQQQPGQFNAAAFKAALIAKIQATIPQNLEQADNFKNQNQLDSVKGDLSNQVKNEKQQAAGAVEEKTKEEPKTEGITPKPVTPLPAVQPGANPNDIGAADAVPKPKAESEVSLQEGSQALDKQMADANITEQQLANANEPEFQTALGAKKSTQAHATTAPVAYRQQEGAIINQAQAQAQTTAQTKLQGMQGEKQKVLSGVLGQQGQTKGQDEAKRAEVANHIQSIYSNTKQKVEKILSELDGQVNSIFDPGAATARSIFENYVDQEMRRYKEERYSGVDGEILWVTDKLNITKLPDKVDEFYREGKQLYLESMDKTIDKIAELVASQLNAAKTEIANGKQEIQQYVASLEPSLQQVGKEAAQNIQGKFNELEQNIDNKQDELIDSLAQKYQENLQAVNTCIEEMKQANRSLFDMAKDALGGVIKTIIELKNMLANLLAKAAGAVERIIADPIGFLGNLVAGIKQGFMNFASNIWQHLKAGLIGWLTGALSSAGIQIPDPLDLKGIFSLVMQILGLTYQTIRSKVAKKLGEKVVAALETGFELFMIIKEQGLAGLWQYIQDKIGDLKTMVLGSIQNFVVESVIKAGVVWVVSLLNPASAFVKACKAIYDIVIFFIERGSQIIELVNAVLDSVTAIANGAIDGAAKFIENALAKALPVVISFLASLLGLGGISEKIQEIVKKLQESIEKAIDWVIAKAVAFAKKIGKKLGFGKKENKKDQPDGRTEEQKKADLDLAMGQANQLINNKELSKKQIEKKLPKIKSQYNMTSLTLVIDNSTETTETYHIHGAINPEGDTPKVDKENGKVDLSELDGWRPRWRSSTNEELASRKDSEKYFYVRSGKIRMKKTAGVNRRHIVSFEVIVKDLKTQVDRQSFIKASIILAGLGYKPNQDNNEAILGASKEYLRDKFNDPKNVWVGDATENQELGQKISVLLRELKTAQDELRSLKGQEDTVIKKERPKIIAKIKGIVKELHKARLDMPLGKTVKAAKEYLNMLKAQRQRELDLVSTIET